MEKSKVLVRKVFELPDGRDWTVEFEIDDVGVSVIADGCETITVGWTWIDDPEALTYHFGDWFVHCFVQLVKELTKIKKAQHIYEALA